MFWSGLTEGSVAGTGALYRVPDPNVAPPEGEIVPLGTCSKKVLLVGAGGLTNSGAKLVVVPEPALGAKFVVPEPALGGAKVVDDPALGAKFVVVEEPAAGVGPKFPNPGTWFAVPLPPTAPALQGAQVPVLQFPVAQSLVIVVTGTL